MNNPNNNPQSDSGGTQVAGCAHAIKKTLCHRQSFEAFQTVTDFIKNAETIYRDSKLSDTTMPPGKLVNGQVKNFWAETKFLELHGAEYDIVLYTGAAPGYHLLDLAYNFPKLRFLIHDNRPGAFNSNLRITQMPNIHMIETIPADARPKFHIDDNLPNFAHQPMGEHCLFKWMPNTIPPHLRQDAEILFPPCGGHDAEELKQMFKLGAPIVQQPDTNYTGMFQCLNRWRHMTITGHCRDCHYAHMCNTNHMRESTNPAINTFKVRMYEDSEVSYRDMLNSTTKLRVDMVPGTAPHPEVKSCRDAVRSVLLKELVGKKIVEAGPRLSHVMHAAIQQVGTHFCVPCIAGHDKAFIPPLCGLNTVCDCMVEDCSHIKGRDVAVLQDVYLKTEQMHALLQKVPRIYWAFNALPHGQHLHLGMEVLRIDGRLKVRPLDSADKQYDDCDPLVVLQEFQHRVVYNNGIYMLVELGGDVDYSTLPPFSGGVLRHLDSQGITGVVPSCLVSQVTPYISHRDTEALTDCISRIQRQFKVRHEELARNAVFCALEEISRQIKHTSAGVVKLMGDIKAGKRVTEGPGSKVLSFISELSEGADHPFIAGLKMFGQTLMGMLTDFAESAQHYLQKISEYFGRKAKGGSGLFRGIFWLLSKLFQCLAQLFGLLTSPATKDNQVVPVPFPSNPDFKSPDVLSEMHVPAETAKSLQTSKLDFAWQYAPTVVDVPPPVTIDRNSIDTTLGVLQNRLGKITDANEPEPEALAIYKSCLREVMDEITNGEPVVPQDFRSGCADMLEPTRPVNANYSSEPTTESAIPASECESSAGLTAFSNVSSSNQGKAATSSDQETCTTDPSLDHISQALSTFYDECQKHNASQQMVPEQPELSLSSDTCPDSLKQTTPPGIYTCPSLCSQPLTTNTAESSGSRRKMRSILRKYCGPTSALAGGTRTDLATDSREPECQETWTQQSATPSSTSPLTVLLHGCPDYLKPTLNSVVKETTAQSPNMDTLAKDLKYLISEGSVSKSKRVKGQLYLTLNSAAVICCKAKLAGRCRATLGKLCDTYLTCLASQTERSSFASLNRKVYVKPWLVRALLLCAHSAIIGGDAPDIPQYQSSTEMSDFTSTIIAVVNSVFRGMLDKVLQDCGGSLLWTKSGSSSISIACPLGSVLTIGSWQPWETPSNDQESNWFRTKRGRSAGPHIWDLEER